MVKFKSRTLLFIILSLFLGCLAIICYTFLLKEEPYQGKSWSPNREYYMQKYQTTGFIQFPTMPGQGSDAIDGYIRIHDKSGKIIHQRFYTFIRDTEAIWSGNKVILMSGGAKEDNALILPSSSE